MKNIAIIPARAGSKRIIGKNIKLFLNKPIIYWVISKALSANLFEDVIVSTDCEEIADISRTYGASVPGLRQAVFSDDYVSVVDVIRYEIGKLGLMEETNQLISLLYATAPMIEGSDLKEAVENIVDFDFAMSVVPFAYPIQRALVIKKNTNEIQMLNQNNFFKRSQDLQKTFHDAAHFIVGKAQSWLTKTPMLNGKTYPVLIPSNRVQDIDEEDDWVEAEKKFSAFRANIINEFKRK
jgi:pseudaminic acid cytidylyltransferase